MVSLLMLPFFLAIRASVKDDGHYHVPVYKYTTQASIYSLNQEGNQKAKVFEMTSSLKCHPRVPDILNCRFDNTDMRFYQQELLDLIGDAIATWDMSAEPFDVRFDRKGVTEFSIDRSMPPWVIGSLRIIIDQLNIGFDMKHRHDGIFATSERSYLGQCETVVNINRRDDDDNESIWNDNSYVIVLIPGFPKAMGEVIEIVKQRNLEECNDDIDPVFGRKGASSTLYGNIPTKTVSSISRVVISDTNYTSFTVNEILANNWNAAQNVKLYEEITLKLESVKIGSFETHDKQLTEGKQEAV